MNAVVFSEALVVGGRIASTLPRWPLVEGGPEARPPATAPASGKSAARSGKKRQESALPAPEESAAPLLRAVSVLGFPGPAASSPLSARKTSRPRSSFCLFCLFCFHCLHSLPPR